MSHRRPGRIELGGRLQELRIELYGDGEIAIESAARDLGLPSATWQNYESGVTIPGAILLHFMTLSGAHPRWLTSGDGPRHLD